MSAASLRIWIRQGRLYSNIDCNIFKIYPGFLCYWRVLASLIDGKLIKTTLNSESLFRCQKMTVVEFSDIWGCLLGADKNKRLRAHYCQYDNDDKRSNSVQPIAHEPWKTTLKPTPFLPVMSNSTTLMPAVPVMPTSRVAREFVPFNRFCVSLFEHNVSF